VAPAPSEEPFFVMPSASSVLLIRLILVLAITREKNVAAGVSGVADPKPSPRSVMLLNKCRGLSASMIWISHVLLHRVSEMRKS